MISLIYATNRDNDDVLEAGLVFRAILDITPDLKELVSEWDREEDVSVFHTLANFVSLYEFHVSSTFRHTV